MHPIVTLYIWTITTKTKMKWMLTWPDDSLVCDCFLTLNLGMVMSYFRIKRCCQFYDSFYRTYTVEFTPAGRWSQSNTHRGRKPVETSCKWGIMTLLHSSAWVSSRYLSHTFACIQTRAGPRRRGEEAITRTLSFLSKSGQDQTLFSSNPPKWS